MGKYFRKWYQSPKTRNEARQNQGDEYIKKNPWCRAKRRPHNLPDPWDDKPRGHQKSWKKFRKTQYHTCGRGKEHTVEIGPYDIHEWHFTEYLTEHGIPYRMDSIKEFYNYKKPIWKRVQDATKTPVYRHVRVKDEDSRSGYTWSYQIVRWEYKSHWEKDGWEMTRAYRVIGYRITWWADKDIGIEYILQRCRNYRNVPYIIR
jgi:hypothetical protein